MEIDYENSSISVVNSIIKYFDLKPYHNTLNELDILLNSKQYKNIVLLVLDGLGSQNLNYSLNKESFLRSNKVKNISTVFPPTTTAATTSLQTGLTPSEHNWYGWDMYFKDTNETISLYLNKVKESGDKPKIDVSNKKYMKFKSIVELINQSNNGKGYYAYPFDKDNPCKDIKEVTKRIELLCKSDDKKFIYGYVDNPDKLMHKYGIYSKVVKDEINNLNNEIEKLSKKVKDTLIIVLADHGLINTKYINLETDAKDLYDMLERTTSIESRATGIKLKKNISKKDFQKMYDKYLKNDFVLLSIDEVISSNLFGNKSNEYLKDAIGDYLIVATGKLSINYSNYSPVFKANHAGYTNAEMYVPLILIDRK